MNINEEVKKWVENNPNKTLADAFLAGFVFHGEFISQANLKKEAKIKEKQKVFYQTLVPFLGQYTKEMLREFYDYWSESDRSMNRLRYEKEKTWEIARRLERWSRSNNDSTFKAKKEEEPTTSKKYKTIE
jgi:hypothetical protein